MFGKIPILLFALFLSHTLCAQLGGDESFAFLRFPSSAKTAAMGGVPLLPLYNDVNQLASQPSLLDSSLHRQVGVNYENYFGNAHFVQAAGSWHSPRWGSFATTLQSLNYGTFAATSETGEAEGTFSANEFALMGHYAQNFSSVFHWGLTAKILLAQMERYTATALAMDISLRYQSLDKLTNATFAVKNMGGQLNAYYEGGGRKKIPFELQLAMAHKFEAAPFGLSFSLNDLQTWNLYKSTETSNSLDTYDSQQESTLGRAGKEFLSHLSIGAGIYPSKLFYLMAGYNYRRSNELSETVKQWGSGFSLGGGLRLKALEINYAWGMYHLSGGTHNVSLLFKL